MPVRIVGGRFRGKRLLAPDGQVTRPTSDRAREALFDILSHGRHRNRLPGARVADFFAGAGTVGLEALSRGAARAAFLERDPNALKVLRKNLAACALDDGVAVVQAVDAANPPKAPWPADILFLDPPYGRMLGGTSLPNAVRCGWLAPNGLVILQQHPKEAFDLPAGLTLVDERRYGAARMFFMEPEDGERHGRGS